MSIKITPTVIFEDDDILSINKPPGMMVHEDGHTDAPLLTDWVRETHPEMVGVGETMRLQNGEMIERPGIVHRLDKDTSGVLVLAKTQESFEFLKQQFQERTIEKLYHAFVWGRVKDQTGTIDKPIGRSKRDFRLWSATTTAGNKKREAITRYTVLGTGENHSYLALEPKTGRTHQIRVHMKAVGHPVVCDTRYGPEKGCALGFSRLALHANTLVIHNKEGNSLVLEAPLPDDFRTAREELQHKY